MAMITRAFLEKQFKNFAKKVDAIFSRRTEVGRSINMTMDNKTYVITIELLNESGGILSTKSVDLPLESSVTNGRYDETTKTLILTLQNGTEVKIPVSDLVSGFLPLSGGTVTGKITLEGDGNALKGNISGYETDLVKIHTPPAGATTGINALFQSGGVIVIGGGESPANIYAGLTDAEKNSENLFIGTDGLIRFITIPNNAYSQRKEMTMNADGSLSNPQGFIGKSTSADGLYQIHKEDTTTDFRTFVTTAANMLFNNRGQTRVIRWLSSASTYKNQHLPCEDSYITVHTNGALNLIRAIAEDTKSNAVYICNCVNTTWSNWVQLTGTDGKALPQDYIVVTSDNKDVLTSTKGTAFFNVQANVLDNYPGVDMVVFQISSGLDAIQLTTHNGTICFRQNDTSESKANWSTTWPAAFTELLKKGDALPTTGGTLTGDLTLSVGDLTLSGDARSVKFDSGVRNGSPIKFYKGDADGSGMVIGDGGRVIIGSGESADKLHTAALGAAASDESTETMHIASDSTVQVHTNCQTIANRKTYTFGADGFLAPPSGGGLKGKSTKAEHSVEVSLSGSTIDFHTWAETPANVLHNFGDAYGGETTIVRYQWKGTSGTFSDMHLPCIDSHIVIHAIPDTDSSGKLTFLWCTAYDIRSRAIYTCMKSVQTNGWTDWTALTGTDGVVIQAVEARHASSADFANGAYALLPVFVFANEDFREYMDELSPTPKVTGGAFLTTYMVTSEENISTYHLPSMSGYIIGIYDPIEKTNKAKYIAYDGSTNAMWSCIKNHGSWSDWVKILNEDGSPAASSGPEPVDNTNNVYGLSSDYFDFSQESLVSIGKQHILNVTGRATKAAVNDLSQRWLAIKKLRICSAMENVRMTVFTKNGVPIDYELHTNGEVLEIGLTARGAIKSGDEFHIQCTIVGSIE